MADSTVFCKQCKKTFTSNRYFKAHLKYEKNVHCKLVWQKQTLPAEDSCNASHKRPSEDDGNNGVTKVPRKDPFFGTLDYVELAVKNYLADNGVAQREHESSVNDEFIPYFASDSENEEELPPAENTGPPPPNTEMRDKFKEYTQWAYQNTCDLPPNIEAGIELMSLLADARAPLNLYDAIYQWHTEHSKATKFISRQTLLEKLNTRYNMKDKVPKVVKNMELPHSKSRIDLVVNVFTEQLQSLLTDPRICDDDYLFFNNNPFQPPPEEFTTVGDINTGRAYRETYKKLIEDPTKEVLLPIIFYMDGAVTGQYDHLPIESLKFTLGIFNAECRDRAYAWRSLGYVTKFLKEETQGQNFIRDSEHIDSTIYLSDDDSVADQEENTEDPSNNTQDLPEEVPNNADPEDEDLQSEDEADVQQQDPKEAKEPKIKSCSGQDLHAMMDKMLESYREVEHGIEWDLRYHGKTHQITFKPFVLFIKGDSQEHDKHCGSYTTRTGVIAQLCRYCCCPNEFTDEPYRRDTPKSPKMIQELIDKKDKAGLQGLSQQYIDNAWYKVRFGMHNELGVHGACCLEILHWLQIGKYGYLRDMFFVQSGKSSKLSANINALAKAMGFLFQRQSDRDLPRTNFSKGIRRGKLMAHEMSGLILVLLATIRCSKGRNLIINQSRGNQRDFLGERGLVKNWIMLLENMLQWEAWLKLPNISVFDIERSEVKVRDLMTMEKEVGKREEGMKFRTFNFHACVHLADDMLNFGVPRNVNTMSNESHHKPDKTAALRTQRRPKLFDMQCAKQIHDMSVIKMGLTELQEGCKTWTYFENLPNNHEENNKQQPTTNHQNNNNQQEEYQEDEEDIGNNIKNGGARVKFFYSEDIGEFTYRVFSKMQDVEKFKLGPDLSKYLEELIDTLGEDVKELNLFTEHIRYGTIFRGSPRYRGKAWRDWVMIDWGDEGGILPAQVWIYVDLRNIQPNLAYEPGIYAVIESAKKNNDKAENDLSEIFKPYIKETTKIHANGKIDRQFYLVDVDTFYEPTVMIPDVGNKNKAAFLRMIPKTKWSELFSEWLAEEHTREFPK